MKHLLIILSISCSFTAFAQGTVSNRWSLRAYGSLPDGSIGLEFRKQFGIHGFEPYILASSGYFTSLKPTGNKTFPVLIRFGPDGQLWPYVSYGIRYYWQAEVFNKNLQPFFVVNRRSEDLFDFYLGAGGLYTFSQRWALFVLSEYGFVFGRDNVFINGQNSGVSTGIASTFGFRYYFWQHKKGLNINEW